jgi:hypothetical protein
MDEWTITIEQPDGTSLVWTTREQNTALMVYGMIEGVLGQSDVVYP